MAFISRIFNFRIISKFLNSQTRTRAVHKAYCNSLFPRTLFSQGNKFANIRKLSSCEHFWIYSTYLEDLGTTISVNVSYFACQSWWNDLKFKIIFLIFKWATSWKNQQCGFRPGPTQTRLYSHRSRLEAWHFRFKKKRKCTIRVA